jgi:hypothetical protein
MIDEWLGEPVVVITPWSTTITQDLRMGNYTGWESLLVELTEDGVEISDRGDGPVRIFTHQQALVLEAITRHTVEPEAVAGLLAQRDRAMRWALALGGLASHIANDLDYNAMEPHTHRWVAAAATDEGLSFEDAWSRLHAEASPAGEMQGRLIARARELRAARADAAVPR